mgnify:CR=1 FL=1
MKMRDFSCEELKSLAVELPDEVSRYEAAGDFEGAGKAIDRWLEKPVGEAMKTRLTMKNISFRSFRRNFRIRRRK